MLKAVNTSTTTVAANGIIPLTIKKNTFPYVSLSNNAIVINKPGVYRIAATMNITATATTSNIGLYNNGTLIPETNATITSVAGNEYQLIVDDIETVVATLPVTSSVSLTLQTTTGLTTDEVNVSVVEIR